MCGIFGIISSSFVNQKAFGILARHAQQRGKDSSGLIVFNGLGYQVYRADYKINRLVSQVKLRHTKQVLGHSRLITNGLSDNQPVVRENVCVLHNGIIVNHEAVWSVLKKKRELAIDTEVIAAIAAEYIEDGLDVAGLPQRVLELCQGVVSCAIALPMLGKLCLFSNNGSLYLGRKNESWIFASESFPLSQIGCTGINQIKEAVFIDIPLSQAPIEISEKSSRTENLVPGLSFSASDEKLLEHRITNVRRCTKCVLPETMPFISFDSEGVCNYCRSYKPRNVPKSKEELFALVEPYRRPHGNDCIVPFSGGRDSCYGLHLVVNELKMKPVAYTYDWGMVTDLGRRNISRMCAKLGVENIFEEKRVYSHGAIKQMRYQSLRFKAILESPGYFNRSLWDTLSGEYYRSFTKKKDYYHIFDYWRWDEQLIDKTLADYDWEKAADTSTTWRIGDGTAAFYNYTYYTVAGFTEHDTFRSNQIREGDITREEALKLVNLENAPRYSNIKWYLDVLGLDFKEVISVVNSIPKLYSR
ncbi:MAG: glucosamine 6-phosphate synthetase [Bacteroidia bacterium]|nr:glucosamine 6-phosphate synthetase [Bacteroidia bacterium]